MLLFMKKLVFLLMGQGSDNMKLSVGNWFVLRERDLKTQKRPVGMLSEGLIRYLGPNQMTCLNL